MLPVLIKVFAGFSKVDGEITEADIDSSLGFLRYDYPETVYSELRQLYSEALAMSVDLNKIAKEHGRSVAQRTAALAIERSGYDFLKAKRPDASRWVGWAVILISNG